MAKTSADEQQRFTGGLCERVGKAIAEIQLCRMSAAFTEARCRRRLVSGPPSKVMKYSCIQTASARSYQPELLSRWLLDLTPQQTTTAVVQQIPSLAIDRSPPSPGLPSEGLTWGGSTSLFGRESKLPWTISFADRVEVPRPFDAFVNATAGP